MPTWLPDREPERLIWIQNAVLKLGVWTGTAGIVAADVTLATGVRDSYQWLLNRSEQINTVKQDLTEYKRIFSNGPIGTPLGAFPAAPTYPAAPIFVPTAGMWDQIVAMMERIRNTVGFTTAIGEDLGIMPPVGGVPLGDPVLELIALPNSEVRGNWAKRTADALQYESQRGNETEWTVLGRDNNPPFMDGRAPLVAGQPEVRRYRGRYVVNDELVGNYSAVASVTTIP
jgi:hypothetical protein